MNEVLLDKLAAAKIVMTVERDWITNGLVRIAATPPPRRHNTPLPLRLSSGVCDVQSRSQ